MDQKPIVLYLRMKRMVFDAIHDDLVRMLGKDAVMYLTVTKYARSAQFSGRKEATPPEAPDVERSPVDEVIYMTSFISSDSRYFRQSAYENSCREYESRIRPTDDLSKRAGPGWRIDSRFFASRTASNESELIVTG
jgi:hypothetical protein